MGEVENEAKNGKTAQNAERLNVGFIVDKTVTQKRLPGGRFRVVPVNLTHLVLLSEPPQTRLRWHFFVARIDPVLLLPLNYFAQCARRTP